MLENTSDSLQWKCFNCVCVCAWVRACVFPGATDGNFHWRLPAVPAEHPGCDSVPAAHLDRWDSRNLGLLCHRLHVLHLCKMLFCFSWQFSNVLHLFMQPSEPFIGLVSPPFLLTHSLPDGPDLKLMKDDPKAKELLHLLN